MLGSHFSLNILSQSELFRPNPCLGFQKKLKILLLIQCLRNNKFQLLLISKKK